MNNLLAELWFASPKSGKMFHKTFDLKVMALINDAIHHPCATFESWTFGQTMKPSNLVQISPQPKHLNLEFSLKIRYFLRVIGLEDFLWKVNS